MIYLDRLMGPLKKLLYMMTNMKIDSKKNEKFHLAVCKLL